ncbi:DNA recombination protein RmuC [Agromyces larvae]|uniref:DNA recombination protein RmuC n=1 Tax=Agromyces larvae TaxID=2929802 RepID=A0ABY4C2T4_9MICO|nr:DNA recombination protein RmuC [Agromyces larvae]UOE45678.1 DNA recombination protein RmuC [Agromyces larvae]
MEILLLIIGLVVGGALGALTVWFVGARRSAAGVAGAVEDPALVEARHQQALLQQRAEADAAMARFAAEQQQVQADLRAQLAARETAVASLGEQLARQEAIHREFTEQQRIEQQERAERDRRELADRAERERRELAERAEQERERSTVLEALKPVRDTLQSMQQKVSELEQQRSAQYGSLAEQLKQAQQNDEQLRQTTESLASALRSNSTRGVWGETQLRRVVEAAGLLNHVDFSEQTQVSTDAGRGRPDMVVHLPGGKYIPLDSKVPLGDYLEASAIPETATGDEGARRKALVDRHVKAMRSHIDALGKKGYWTGLESPEFVIAFIPNESLLSAALEADPLLLNHAFERRVALASPVNLFAVLKTIDYAWQQQAVSDEAKKLFDLGNTLYQRIGVLAGHADGLRKAIERTVDSYNKFASSLESRVLVTARQFPGINEQKLELVAEPQVIHEQPRRLASPELTDALGDGPGAADTGEIDLVADPEVLPIDDDAFDGADLDPEIRSTTEG